jgi:hypothetical protein
VHLAVLLAEEEYAHDLWLLAEETEELIDCHSNLTSSYCLISSLNSPFCLPDNMLLS